MIDEHDDPLHGNTTKGFFLSHISIGKDILFTRLTVITGLHCFLQLNAGGEGMEIADALKELEMWKVGLS